MKRNLSCAQDGMVPINIKESCCCQGVSMCQYFICHMLCEFTSVYCYTSSVRPVKVSASLKDT